MSDTAVWHDLVQTSLNYDLDYLAQRSSGRVLELGAGTGRVALYIAATGHEVVAVDRDPVLLEELGRRAAKLNGASGSVTIVEADALKLPGTLGHFDTILLSNGFHEIIGPRHVQRTLLRRLRSHLFRTGRMLVVSCDLDGIENAAPTEEEYHRGRWLVRRCWLEAVWDDDANDRYEMMWRRQVRPRWTPIWFNREPFWQDLWPSQLHEDARAVGLRVSDHRIVYTGRTTRLIVTELVHD